METQVLITFLGSAAIGALVGGLFSLLNTTRNHKKESESWLRNERRDLYLKISEKNDDFLSSLQSVAYGTRVVNAPKEERVYDFNEAEAMLEIYGQRITPKLNQLRIEQTKIQILGSRESAERLSQYRTQMKENVETLFAMDSKQPNLDATIDGLLVQQEQLWREWEDSARADLGNKK
ncbi:hypothetical protein ACT17S_02465 [Glutamicibacter mysorens]